jgi:hypothetical protein
MPHATHSATQRDTPTSACSAATSARMAFSSLTSALAILTRCSCCGAAPLPLTAGWRGTLSGGRVLRGSDGGRVRRRRGAWQGLRHSQTAAARVERMCDGRAAGCGIGPPECTLLLLVRHSHNRHAVEAVRSCCVRLHAATADQSRCLVRFRGRRLQAPPPPHLPHPTHHSSSRHLRRASPSHLSAWLK